jgi:hypothetical protein
MSQWFEQAVFWHVYPLGFLGAEKSALPPGFQPVHRLQELEPWLDYLHNLGCNGLLLGPIFSSETHGYDTIDHYQIDTRLGTMSAVNSLHFKTSEPMGSRQDIETGSALIGLKLRLRMALPMATSKDTTSWSPSITEILR